MIIFAYGLGWIVGWCSCVVVAVWTLEGGAAWPAYAFMGAGLALGFFINYLTDRKRRKTDGYRPRQRTGKKG